MQIPQAQTLVCANACRCLSLQGQRMGQGDHHSWLDHSVD